LPISIGIRIATSPLMISLAPMPCVADDVVEDVRAQPGRPLGHVGERDVLPLIGRPARPVSSAKCVDHARPAVHRPADLHAKAQRRAGDRCSVFGTHVGHECGDPGDDRIG
jgi:hypothetical protein